MTWIYLLFVASVALIVAGVALLAVPAGVIAAGVAGLVLWWMFGDDGSDDAKDRSLPSSL